MPRYRKKPVEIEAFQLTREDMDGNEDWPEWLNEAWQRPNYMNGAMFLDHAYHAGKMHRHEAYRIRTLEGVMAVARDDWIIRGVEGELYSCKPNIFAQTYDLVLENES